MAAAQPSAVLFACTLNIVRSPMAAALMRHFLRGRVYVESVGVRAGEPDGFAIAVMEEIGIDLQDHRPKTFDDLDDAYFDLIISLSPEAQHKAVEMTRTMDCEVEFWPTLDPTVIEGNRDTRLDAYRTVRDGLMTRILERFGAPPPTV